MCLHSPFLYFTFQNISPLVPNILRECLQISSTQSSLSLKVISRTSDYLFHLFVAQFLQKNRYSDDNFFIQVIIHFYSLRKIFHKDPKLCAICIQRKNWLSACLAHRGLRTRFYSLRFFKIIIWNNSSFYFRSCHLKQYNRLKRIKYYFNK